MLGGWLRKLRRLPLATRLLVVLNVGLALLWLCSARGPVRGGGAGWLGLARAQLAAFAFAKHQIAELPRLPQARHRPGWLAWFWCPAQPKPGTIVTSGDGLWQVANSDSKTKLYLFAAHLDARPHARSVRVLGMAWRRAPAPAPFCLLWSTDNATHEAVRATVTRIWLDRWDPRDAFHVPLLLSCALRADQAAPSHVSLVPDPCAPRPAPNLLPVLRSAAPPRLPGDSVVVCVKGTRRPCWTPARDWVGDRFYAIDKRLKIT